MMIYFANIKFSKPRVIPATRATFSNVPMKTRTRVPITLCHPYIENAFIVTEVKIPGHNCIIT